MKSKRAKIEMRTVTLKMPEHLIELIHKEAEESGRMIQRVVIDIVSAHYEEKIGK